MAYLGDFKNSVGVASPGVPFIFTTVKACGVPVALASGAAKVIKNGATGAPFPHSTGVTLTQNLGSITGLNKVVVLTSAALYTSGNYDVILSTGSVNGINVKGYLVGSFSIMARSNPSATGVWAVTSRTLSSGSVMWSAASRSLTSGASVWSYTGGAGRNLTATGRAYLASGVWALGTRTLSSGLVVWSVASRTLTSGLNVWNAGTRTLTSGLTVGASVWAAGTRTLTSGLVGARSNWAFASGAGRSLTATGKNALVSGVWANATRLLTSGSIVWSAAGRTLTSGAMLVGAALTEVAAVPAAAPTLGQAIMFGYQAARNKRVTTSAGDTIYTSATGAVGTAALSYVSGTNTFTKAKYA